MSIFDISKRQPLLTKSRNTSSSLKKKSDTLETQKEHQMRVSTSYLKNIFIQKTEPNDKNDKRFPQIKSNPNIYKDTRDKDHYDYQLIMTKPENTVENPSEKDKSTLFSIQTKNQSERESLAPNTTHNKDKDKDKDLLISQLNQKLNQSSRTIKQLTSTNHTQQKALEKLSSELDTYISNASKTMLKNNSGVVKETPMEIVIKVKEKELKNAMTLIDILTKDNNNLQLLLNKTGLQEHHTHLMDQLKEKERHIQNILTENKYLKKQIEDYRIELKEKKELEEVVSRVQRDLLTSIEDNNKLKTRINNERTISPNALPEYNTININASNNNNNSNANRLKVFSPSPLDNKFGTNKTRSKKIRLVMLNDKSKQDSISFISEIAKTSVPKKNEKLNYHIEKDNLMNKIQELKEKNEYLNKINKDTEMTVKHLQCQVNEYKIEANIYKRKYKESLEREAILKKVMHNDSESPLSVVNNKLMKTESTANNNVESISSSKKITECFKMIANE